MLSAPPHFCLFVLGIFGEMCKPACGLRFIRLMVLWTPPTQVLPWRVHLLPKRWVKRHLGTTNQFLGASQSSPRPQHLFLQMNLLATLNKEVATIPAWKPTPKGVFLLVNIHPRKEQSRKVKAIQTVPYVIKTVPLDQDLHWAAPTTTPPLGVSSGGWAIWLSFSFSFPIPSHTGFVLFFAKMIDKLLLWELERSLSGKEHGLLYRRTWVQFPGPTWQLMAVCHSSSWESEILTQAFMQAKHQLT